MKIVEVSHKEFTEVSELEDNYFSNGVIFDLVTDNVVGFVDMIARKGRRNLFHYYLLER